MVHKAMSENGSPEPYFETDEERTYMFVRIPIHPQMIPHVTQEVMSLVHALGDRTLGRPDSREAHSP